MYEQIEILDAFSDQSNILCQLLDLYGSKANYWLIGQEIRFILLPVIADEYTIRKPCNTIRHRGIPRGILVVCMVTYTYSCVPCTDRFQIQKYKMTIIQYVLGTRK